MEQTSHALCLFFRLLRVKLNITPFTVPRITTEFQFLNHLNTFHYKRDTTQQYKTRWSTSSAEILHIKHQLTYIIFLFLNFSAVKITSLTAIQVKNTHLSVHWGSIPIDTGNSLLPYQKLLIIGVNRKHANFPLPPNSINRAFLV